MYRGAPFSPPYNAREVAIQRFEQQMAQKSGRGKTDPAWTPIGPAPIPNGQTTPSNPVSGRVTDRNGLGVSQQQVCFAPTSSDAAPGSTAPACAYNDLDGRYTLVLAPGSYSFSVEGQLTQRFFTSPRLGPSPVWNRQPRLGDRARNRRFEHRHSLGRDPQPRLALDCPRPRWRYRHLLPHPFRREGDVGARRRRRCGRLADRRHLSHDRGVKQRPPAVLAAHHRRRADLLRQAIWRSSDAHLTRGWATRSF